MGIRTRSATSSPVKPSSRTLEPQAEQYDPLKLFILPEDGSVKARFLLLQHPRDSIRKRFYFCPQRGLYEFTKIAGPSIDPRSILFEPTAETEADDITQDAAEIATRFHPSNGYVKKAAEFFIATPFDATFLLVPILISQKFNGSLFKPLEDILEHQLDENKHLKYVFKHGRQLLEDAVDRICDKVEAGDEDMYRLSEGKLLKELIAKCERVIERGLPSSLEDKFVTRALETPILSIKREETTSTIATTTGGELANDEIDSLLDTQSSTPSTAPSTTFSEGASVTTVSSTVEDNANAKLKHHQQLRTVFTFITSNYMPAHICAQLMSLLDSEISLVDFTLLKNHLAQLTSLRAEAAGSRSLGDFSRKRGLEDEEVNETREEKKRKLAEEEKRKKAGESVAVRALKKVDVTGMKKMSSFFTKAATKAKS